MARKKTRSHGSAILMLRHGSPSIVVAFALQSCEEPQLYSVRTKEVAVRVAIAASSGSEKNVLDAGLTRWMSEGHGKFGWQRELQGLEGIREVQLARQRMLPQTKKKVI